MIESTQYTPKISNVLFELDDKFEFLINLYKSNNLPKVLMLTGNKGIGKFTLVNHFLNYIHEQNNYDYKVKTIKKETSFYSQSLKNVVPNILFLSGCNFTNIKIEDIRELKKMIFKTTLTDKQRFIILDDVELFNKNSLNALLKLIEEPSNTNNFILINNRSKPLLQTVISRCLEIKFFLNEDKRKKIISALIKKHGLKDHIDYEKTYLSPGNFFEFNNICALHKIDLSSDYLKNLKKLLEMYKKDKNISFINLIFFLNDFYFSRLRSEGENINDILLTKDFINKNIKDFLKLNLNPNLLMTNLNKKLAHE